MARKNYAGSIHLLTDQPASAPADAIHVHDIRQWYNPKKFQTFEQASHLDPLFRGGFWLKTAERFFVLEQFLEVSGFTSMFHAELDVLVLDLDGYHSVLDQHGSGLFAPFDAPQRGCASLIYINDRDALKALCEFTVENAELGSEMAILGHFLDKRPDMAHALPSDQVFANELWPLSSSTVPSQGGIVDAMSFGLWVLGQDPRNHQHSTRNHFRTGFNNHPMENLSFRASMSGSRMWVSAGGPEWFPLRAIHVHSKAFGRLRLPGILALYAFLANRRFNTIMTVKPGSLWAVLVAGVLSTRSAPVLIRLPRVVRTIIPRLLTQAISRSPRLLSERQRKLLISLMPTSPLAATNSREPHKNRAEVTAPERWSPSRFEPIVSRYPSSTQEDIWRACGVLWHALTEATEPTVYVLSDGNPLIPPVATGAGSQVVLWPSSRKDYDATRHTVGFWSHLSLDERWSFSLPAQVLHPEWVKEMFPAGSDDLAKWLESGLGRPPGTLNAFQAYGTYAWSIHPREVTLRRSPLSEWAMD